jgi:hypothetical protein
LLLKKSENQDVKFGLSYYRNKSCSKSYEITKCSFTAIPALLITSLFRQSVLYLRTPWRYRSCTTLAASIFCGRFRDSKFLQDGVVSPTPNLEDQGISLNLASPSKPVRHGGPTSSCAAAGIALEFIGAHKPLTQQQSAFGKVKIPPRGQIVLYNGLIRSKLQYTFVVENNVTMIDCNKIKCIKREYANLCHCRFR